jgi:hypothetical protein
VVEEEVELVKEEVVVVVVEFGCEMEAVLPVVTMA